jgi:hypothetical protein
MKRFLVLTALLAIACIGLAGVAKADSTTDTALNVVYTATIGADGDLVVTVDATGFNQGSGFLTALSIQLPGATAVTLESASGGVAGWSGPMTPGGLNSSGCDSKALGAGFWCIQNVSANLAVPAGSVYTFEYDVTGLTTTLDGDGDISSDVKAAYNTAADNSGKNLGLTSQSIDISTTPHRNRHRCCCWAWV